VSALKPQIEDNEFMMPITDTQRIDFIASLEQSICQLSMPKEVVLNNLNLRDAVDCCIAIQKNDEE
jgi:hypothetical protein